jgi:hypothetical protein
LAAWHRVYFAAVGSFALWVGLWGYFVPAEIVRAIPWQVPPLHARFIGSMYLSGMVLMAGGLLTEGRSDTRTALWMASIWTGMLLLVSLLHLGEFDWTHRPVWFWFGAYIVYPIAGAWLAWLYRVRHPAGTAAVPAVAKAWLTGQGVVCIALAVALFFAPSFMGSVWPWKIPVLLTQIYAGPFLSYGIGSLLLARHRDWADIRIALISMFVFALLVLIGSLIHRATFGEIGIAATIWFAGFLLATLMLAWLSLWAVLEGRR